MTEQWTVEDGLPVNGVTDTRFGPGGYLYLATIEGLVRFNGQEFKTFTVGSNAELPSNRFLRFAWAGPEDLLVVTEQRELVYS